MKKVNSITHWILFVGLSLFSGCTSTKITNMTPSVVTQNDSNKYTATIRVSGYDGDISKKSLHPYIVINSEKHPMEKHPDGNNVFVYDCDVDGIGKVPFYVEVLYEKIGNKNSIKKRMLKSNLFSFTISDKIVFAMDSYRGPVNTTVKLMGKGFDKTDKVCVGSTIIPTNVISSSEIEFTIPAIPLNRSYDVILLSGTKEFFAGKFYIDEATITCTSDYIRLMKGESQTIAFIIDHPATAQGVELQVTTDIPESIFMDEVVIPYGESSVSTTITGDEVGSGTLSVFAPGFNSIEIPVEVYDYNAVSIDNANMQGLQLEQPNDIVNSNDMIDNNQYAQDNYTEGQFTSSPTDSVVL